MSGPSWSKEVHFIARDFDGREAVWQTDAVILKRLGGVDDELTFVLENRTATEHAFVMPGAKAITREVILNPEQSVDIPEPVAIPHVEPLIVTVKSGERKTVRVHAGELVAPKSAGKSFRYFCTIHQDVHRSGELFVM